MAHVNESAEVLKAREEMLYRPAAFVDESMRVQ